MHSISEVGANVPAFLAKLWKLVEDPETNDLICWNETGSGFVIHNQAQFCKKLLPLYYKHNNMASFVRQLNMYGFHKKVSVDSGGLKLDKDEMEFAHPCFLRRQSYLLENIKRKIAEATRTPGKAPEIINRVLGDVKQMKGRQETLDTQLASMKRENEALWRELAVLRQKHIKQQQIVNKLIQFLLTMVQSPGNRLGIKRRLPPLMLNDKEHHHHHHHKHKHHRHAKDGAASTSTSDILGEVSGPVESPSSYTDDDPNKHDDVLQGPTIHELDPNTEYVLPDRIETTNMTSPVPDSASPVPSVTESPVPAPSPDLGARSPIDSELGLNMEQEASLPVELLLNDTATSDSAQQSTSDIALFNNGADDVTQSSTISSREDFDSHLDTMQNDIENLKELLSKESCTLDANTLLSLFADDPISLGMGLPSQDKDDDIMGSELIAYNPSLFDLTEDASATASTPTEGPGEVSSLFPALEQQQETSTMDNLLNESELSTPNPKMECPEFPSPAKRKRK